MNQEENMRKSYMRKILNQKKKITKGCIKREKCLNMVEKFCQQIQICTLFAQHVIGVFISVVSDCLNMKNIIFSLHNCIVRLDHLIKKFICFIFLCYTCQKHISRNEI